MFLTQKLTESLFLHCHKSNRPTDLSTTWPLFKSFMQLTERWMAFQKGRHLLQTGPSEGIEFSTGYTLSSQDASMLVGWESIQLFLQGPKLIAWLTGPEAPWRRKARLLLPLDDFMVLHDCPLCPIESQSLGEFPEQSIPSVKSCRWPDVAHLLLFNWFLHGSQVPTSFLWLFRHLWRPWNFPLLHYFTAKIFMKPPELPLCFYDSHICAMDYTVLRWPLLISATLQMRREDFVLFIVVIWCLGRRQHFRSVQ